MVDESPVAERILLCAEGLSTALHSLIVRACEKAGVEVVECDPSTLSLAGLENDPLLIVGALPLGARSVPQALYQWSSRFLPGIPVCLFTEESLVRPSLRLHHGALRLVGAPLSELRVASILIAWLRERSSRGSRSTSNGASHEHAPRLTGSSVGQYLLASFQSVPDNSDGLVPIASGRLGVGSMLALAPRGSTSSLESWWERTTVKDDLDNGVVVSTDAGTGCMSIRARRDDVEMRLCSPVRTPNAFNLQETCQSGRGRLQMQPGDILLLSWPKGAVPRAQLEQIMMDGLNPLLAALESLFAAGTTAFSAAAIEVRG
ncbi:MAG: hypothetical protein ACO3JL_09965 [Myxococcota bacterium]